MFEIGCYNLWGQFKGVAGELNGYSRGGQMNSRKYERKPVAQAVKLVCDGRVISTSEVVDMSRGGLGIKSSAKRLSSGQIVDIDFYKPGHPRGISFCMRAMVVHAGPETTGLMFSEDQSLEDTKMH